MSIAIITLVVYSWVDFLFKF